MERGAAKPFEGWGGQLIYNAHYWTVFWSLTLGWSYRASGRENIPKNGPALLLANHQCFLDPILVSLAAGRPLTFLARSSLFRGGWFDRLIRNYGAVPINRDSPRDGIRTVLDCLAQDRAVLMFPEGERTYTGHMSDIKAGVALLIEKSNVPVIPIGIAGAFDLWPRTRMMPGLSPLFMPLNSHCVAVHVGELIETKVWCGMSRAEILMTLEREISRAQATAESLKRHNFKR